MTRRADPRRRVGPPVNVTSRYQQFHWEEVRSGRRPSVVIIEVDEQGRVLGGWTE